jgi:hypothetical protein
MVEREHGEEEAENNGRFKVVLFDHYSTDSESVPGKGYKRVENALRKAAELNRGHHDPSASFIVISPTGRVVDCED